MGSDRPVISDAVRVGDLVFLSGRADVDPDTLSVRNAEFEGQARSVFADIDDVLGAAGSSRERVLRIECFLARGDDFEAWNRIWAEFFPSPRPARTTIVAASTVPGLLIEVNVTAALVPSGEPR